MSQPTLETPSPAAPRSVPQAFLDRLPRSPLLERRSLGSFQRDGVTHEVPHLILRSSQTSSSALRLGVFGGIHGDEPASWEALLPFIAETLENPSFLEGFELHLYPMCNPSGIAAGSRETSAGIDLNRDFWCDSEHPETRLLENELRTRHFQGIIALHADDTAEGLYGYTHGQLLNDALIRPALAAAEPFLPRDTRPRIDGWQAHDGVISDCFCGVLSAPKDQSPQPFDVIFETPARAPLHLQIQAASTALKVIVAKYRTFIAYAQDL